MTKKKQTEQPKTVLVLRCCAPDMSSQNGFVWPGMGEEAVAPDWKDDGNCDHGLHGWLYGQGNHGCSDYWSNSGAKWLVVEVELSSVVMLGGKVKFPRGTVRFVGERHEAAAYLIAHEPQAAGVAVIGASLSVGDEQAVHVGALGTATAGDGGAATAGDGGTATAGYRGTATAGDGGTATAGYRGTATAGDGGTATAGYRGTATAGDGGELRIRWYDSKADRYRLAIAYVGEDGIEPNVAYRLDDEHKFVRAATPD
jgi:hypothetical protein